MSSVLIKPMITEKLTRIQEQQNKYSFQVSMNSTKTMIREEVERLYPDVNVVSVNTLISATKPKGRFTRGGYIAGRSPKIKKAIVTLKEGQEIDFFSEI
jgi:large subunit ribosomal protein L23